MAGIKWRAVLIAVACLLLFGCSMKPQELREKLDECQQLGFDALVYNRERDGAVMKVLCIPKDDEVDHSVSYPLKWSKLINRWLPYSSPSNTDTHPQHNAGGKAQE